MTLTYRLEGKGYVIMDSGVDWVVQESFIPFPRDTVEKSAQAHINEILANREPSNQEETKVAQQQQQIADLQDALIELASAVEGGLA